jgi:hypothetical protein
MRGLHDQPGQLAGKELPMTLDCWMFDPTAKGRAGADDHGVHLPLVALPVLLRLVDLTIRRQEAQCKTAQPSC